MALISNTDSSVLPYNDDYLVYDLDRRMYVITDKAVDDLIGERLEVLAGSKVKADLIRYEVSEDIYTYIAMYSLYSSFKYKKWLLAKDDSLRDMFLRVLVNQMRYYIRSGAGLLKDMHGVQVEKSRAMTLDQLRGNVLVSANVEQMLKQSGLLYTGQMYYSDFSEDGTW